MLEMFKTQVRAIRSLCVVPVLSINYGSAISATVKITFDLFLLGGVDFVIAVLVWTLHILHFIFI